MYFLLLLLQYTDRLRQVHDDIKLLTLSVSDEGYSRNAFCALN